jgi:hypothetical protein
MMARASAEQWEGARMRWQCRLAAVVLVVGDAMVVGRGVLLAGVRRAGVVMVIFPYRSLFIQHGVLT